MFFFFVPQWGFSVVAELPWGDRSEREACGPWHKAALANIPWEVEAEAAIPQSLWSPSLCE